MAFSHPVSHPDLSMHYMHMSACFCYAPGFQHAPGCAFNNFESSALVPYAKMTIEAGVALMEKYPMSYTDKFGRSIELLTELIGNFSHEFPNHNTECSCYSALHSCQCYRSVCSSCRAIIRPDYTFHLVYSNLGVIITRLDPSGFSEECWRLISLLQGEIQKGYSSIYRTMGTCIRDECVKANCCQCVIRCLKCY